MISDLRTDGNRCKRCGYLLHRHYGSKRRRCTLREWDGGLVIATFVDIRCQFCGGLTSIFYQADMLPPPSPRRGRFAAVAAA